MNLTLKAVYFCATSDRMWGKGFTIDEAKKAAGIKGKAKVDFYVKAALFNDPTEDELNNIYACIVADSIDGNPEYYKDGRLEADTKMINRLHVGWLTVEHKVN